MPNSGNSSSAPFAGLLIASIGLVFLFFMGLTTNVNCNRLTAQQVDCKVLTQLGPQIFSMERNIQQVLEAEISSNCEQDCSYRVDLLTSKGVEPLTIAYTSGFNHNASAALKINQFLQNNSLQNLEFRLGGKENIGLWAVLPFVFTGAGLVILFSSFLHQE